MNTKIKADRMAFATAGNATVTLESLKTGKRFTYKITAPRDGGDRVRFVRLLTGPNNNEDFGYIGYLKHHAGPPGAWRFHHGQGKAVAGATAPSVKAIHWFVRNPDDPRVAVHHAGKCGRCGRKLTVPESLASGLGPVCAAMA